MSHMARYIVYTHAHVSRNAQYDAHIIHTL